MSTTVQSQRWKTHALTNLSHTRWSYLRCVLTQPVIRFAEIIKDNPGAILLPGGEDNGRTRVSFRGDPRTMKCVRYQEKCDKKNNCCCHFVFHRVWRVCCRFLRWFLLTSGYVQILEKQILYSIPTNSCPVFLSRRMVLCTVAVFKILERDA